MPTTVKICSDCGEEYRLDALQCADCGGELVVQDVEDDGTPVVSPQPAAAEPPAAAPHVLFVTPNASDLVPLAEALREAKIDYHLAEQAPQGEGAPTRYALVVADEDAAAALRVVAPLLSPHEAAEEMDGVAARFSAERGYVACPACGAAAAPGAAECAECGLGLGAAETEDEKAG